MAPQTSAYYRARAEQCERLAADSTSPESREIMTFLAHRWRALIAENKARKNRLRWRKKVPAEVKGPGHSDLP